MTQPALRSLAALVALAVPLAPLPASAESIAHGASGGDRPAQPAQITGDGGPGRYLVRFAPEASVATQVRSLKAQGIGVGRTFGDAVKAAVVSATPAQAKGLERRSGVEAVAPDSPVTVSAETWGRDRVDQRDLPLSGSYTPGGTGAGVPVYVVDTGVLPRHQVLEGRVLAGATAIDDGVGTGDCDGHGTHVAGTVAGTSTGVATAATIVPVRVLDCNGSGYMSDVVAGLDWVAEQHQDGTPAVVNLSLGGSSNTVVDAAVQGVVDDGVTAVLAAGNESVDACTTSPARAPAGVTVAATDQTDTQAWFSNFGSCVDLYAPGVNIRSSWYTGSTAYASLSGTSMAAPHVAGAAAVVLQADPTATPAEVAARLVEGATTGRLRSLSAGSPNRLLYVDAAGTLAPAPGSTSTPAPEPDVSPAPSPSPTAQPPTRARDVAASPRSRAALVTWVRGRARGAAITRQTVVTYRFGSRVKAVTVGPAATRLKVVRLKPGRGYTFRVIERSAAGSSPPSLPSRAVRVRR